jgi:rhodanese-related sulfurtransferase
MTPAEVQAAIAEGAILLDMRPPKPFATEHVPQAVNFQFNRADLADRAEMSLTTDATYVVHAEPEPIAKVAVQLLTEGGFTVLGHLEGGLKGWKEAGLATAMLTLIDVDTLQSNLDAYRVVDTRERFEYKYGHIEGADNLDWTDAWALAPGVPDDRPIAVVCGDQVRSAFAASILQRLDKDVTLVFGGMVDWLERGYPVVKGLPPS